MKLASRTPWVHGKISEQVMARRSILSSMLKTGGVMKGAIGKGCT